MRCAPLALASMVLIYGCGTPNPNGGQPAVQPPGQGTTAQGPGIPVAKIGPPPPPQPVTDCGARVAVNPNVLKFAGLEIPLVKGLPIKLASFYYGPEQVEAVTGAVQALDLLRMQTCQTLQAFSQTDPNYNSYVLKVHQMDAEVAAVSTIMQTDSSQLSVWTQRQQAFFKAEVSSQDEAANPALKQALDTFKVANAHSNQRTLGIEPGKRWVLDKDLPAGDCILKAGSYIDVDPVAGRGHFSLTAYTTHTTSTDVWHQRWQVLDGNNSVVATFGGAGIVDVGDLKDDHIPKSNSGVVVWPPNAFTSGQAALVSWQGAC